MLMLLFVNAIFLLHFCCYCQELWRVWGFYSQVYHLAYHSLMEGGRRHDTCVRVKNLIAHRKTNSQSVSIFISRYLSEHQLPRGRTKELRWMALHTVGCMKAEADWAWETCHLLLAIASLLIVLEGRPYLIPPGCWLPTLPWENLGNKLSGPCFLDTHSKMSRNMRHIMEACYSKIIFHKNICVNIDVCWIYYCCFKMK